MIEDNAISVFDQDTTNNPVEQLVLDQGVLMPPDYDDSIVLIEGEWQDPRQTFTVRVTKDHGAKINGVGKLQRSVTGTLPDGTTILVSAFGDKAQSLKVAKLGEKCIFRGEYKEKTKKFNGQERTSRYLNL